MMGLRQSTIRPWGIFDNPQSAIPRRRRRPAGPGEGLRLPPARLTGGPPAPPGRATR